MATNQIIEFQGERVYLGSNQQWAVHKQVTTIGLYSMRRLKFQDFERCIHKWQDGHFHLFELHKGNFRCVAYCCIKNKIK
jgi:hypothetical protein